MATYKEIQSYIRHRYSVTVKTCWIADMKEECGLPLRTAPNRASMERRLHPCPDAKKGMIIDAFRHFGMIG